MKFGNAIEERAASLEQQAFRELYFNTSSDFSALDWQPCTHSQWVEVVVDRTKEGGGNDLTGMAGAVVAEVDGDWLLKWTYDAANAKLRAVQTFPLSLTVKLAPRKEGVLTRRQNPRGMSKPLWKQRKCSMQGNQLAHYSSPSGGKLKGRLGLSGATIEWVQNRERNFCFKVHPDRHRSFLWRYSHLCARG
jgi:hypothetical protein